MMTVKLTTYDTTISMSLEQAEEFCYADTEIKVVDQHNRTIGRISSEEFIERKQLRKCKNGYPIMVAEFNQVKNVA